MKDTEKVTYGQCARHRGGRDVQHRGGQVKITQTRKIEFTNTISVGRLGAFVDSIPDYAQDKAVIRVSKDSGGGTPTDPGGLVTVTAEWVDEEEE